MPDMERDSGLPLISGAITCWNAEATIQRAVERALAQTWTARESLIVDDGSEDRGERIVRSEDTGSPRMCLAHYGAQCAWESPIDLVSTTVINMATDTRAITSKTTPQTAFLSHAIDLSFKSIAQVNLRPVAMSAVIIGTG